MRHNAFKPARQLLQLIAVSLVGSCGPTTLPTLALSANPRDVNDQGEEITITVEATDSSGKIGKGTVTVSSGEGSLYKPVDLTLDELGVAKVKFSCKLVDDSDCVGKSNIKAKWVTEGKTIIEELSVKVTPRPPAPWETGVTFDSNARLASCSGALPMMPVACDASGACIHGFTCVENQCILNGGNGGLQFTAQFSQSVDVDLHVMQPVADGGSCEIWYGDRNRLGEKTSCGAIGALDLDSNAGCHLDNVNVENIIFPATAIPPPPGQYIVRLDYFQACSAMPVDYQVKVRAGSMIRFYCGQFQAGDADHGAALSGVTLGTVTVPPP